MNLNFKYITTLSAHVTRILQGLIILILVARQYEVSVFADYIFITTISGIILRILRSGVDTYYFSTFSEKKDLRLTVLFVCFILGFPAVDSPRSPACLCVCVYRFSPLL